MFSPLIETSRQSLGVPLQKLKPEEPARGILLILLIVLPEFLLQKPLLEHGYMTIEYENAKKQSHGGCGTFFTFLYFASEAGWAIKVVLHAKPITIRYAWGASSCYCQGERKTKNL
jgi:hypothetical protein